MPVRTSVTSRITSASLTASRACCSMAASMGSSDSGTRPPVSTTVNFFPNQSASA